jgi:hypothetical protein
MPTPSLISFFAPRVTDMPSTASVAQEVKYHAGQVTRALNGLPSFSIFSWSSPESNVTAQAATLGFNLAPASVASTLWLKKTGSGSSGWIALG